MLTEYENGSPAIRYCKEYGDGMLFAGNREYEFQVNFCPICGHKAKIHVEIGVDK